jgi:hypothetical protein
VLVSEVIDRVFSDIFWPSGIDRPTFDVLSGDISSATLTVTLEGRISNVPRDTMLEIGDELILSKSVTGTVVTANERGWLNTAPVSHASGTKAYIDPAYTRLSVFNSLKACIGLLYPWGLYWRKVETGPVWNTTEPLALNAGVKDVFRVLCSTSSTHNTWATLRQENDHWQFYNEFDPPLIHFMRGGYTGRATKIVTAHDFTIPTTTSEDLDTLGIPSTLQAFLPLAVAGYILQNREVPRVQIDDVRRLLASQGVQIGASMNVGQAMVNAFRSIYIPAERRRLAELDPPTFTFVGS